MFFLLPLLAPIFTAVTTTSTVIAASAPLVLAATEVAAIATEVAVVATELAAVSAPVVVPAATYTTINKALDLSSKNIDYDITKSNNDTRNREIDLYHRILDKEILTKS